MMNKWKQSSLGTKLAVILVASVLGMMGGSFYLLNQSNKKNLGHFADASALSMLQSTHDGLVSFMELGEMEMLQEMIEHTAEAEDVVGLRVLAQGHVTEYASAEEHRRWPVPDTVWAYARTEDAPLVLQEPEYLDFYQAQHATEECMACHDDWKEGDVAGILHLRYSKQALKQAEQQFAMNGLLITFITVLMLTAILVFAIRRMVVQPVSLMASQAKHLAQQDLAYFIDEAARESEEELLEDAASDGSEAEENQSRDEVGALKEAFHWMVSRIKKALREAHEKGVAAEQAAEQAAAERARAEDQQTYLAEKVDQMLVEMNRFAEGDLTVHLEADRDDDIAKLYAGFNRAAAELRGMVDSVRLGVGQAIDAFGQIHTATEQLSASVREQSGQSTEVAASVEEMARTIIENARHTTEMASASARNRQDAQDGGDVVGRTVEKIREVGVLTTHTAESIDRFAQSSRAIDAIVQTIEEIADQTNLLALNAAIEAARAGDQGRGFAVVADEVRKLAERTTQATREIAQMIKGIQVETTEAVEVMGKSKTSVEESIRLAEKAGASLTGIVAATKQAEDMIGQIAAASEEQSATSEQISRSVEVISTVSNESATGITEIVGSLDALREVTGELRTLVARFHTESGKTSRDREPAARTVARRGAGATA